MVWAAGRACILLVLASACGKSVQRAQSDGSETSGAAGADAGVAGTGATVVCMGVTGGAGGPGRASGGAGGDGGRASEGTRLFYVSDGAFVSTDFDGGDSIELCPKSDTWGRYTLVGTDGEALIVYRERSAIRRSEPDDVAVLRVALDGSECTAICTEVESDVYNPVHLRPLSPVSNGRVVLVIPSNPPPDPGYPPTSGLASVRTDGTGLVVLAPTDVDQAYVLDERVLYTDAYSELYSSHAEFAQRTPLVPWPGSKSFTVASGKRLVVNVFPNRVVSVDSDGQGLVDLATSPDTYAHGVVGETVVIHRDVPGIAQVDLFAVPLSGGELVPLATGAGMKAFVAASGERIVYLVYDANEDDEDEDHDLWSVRRDGTDPLPIAATPEQESVHAVDGDRVVFSRRPPDFSVPPMLLSARLDGTEVTTLADGTDAVSTIVDGRVVFYAGTERTVFSVPITGGTPIALAGGAETTAVYGRLGRTLIVYLGDGFGEGELVRVDADGSNRTVLSASAYYVGALTERCGILPRSFSDFPPCDEP